MHFLERFGVVWIPAFAGMTKKPSAAGPFPSRTTTMLHRIKHIAAASAFALLALTGPAAARDIVDMAGRTVTVPDDIRHVFAMSHSFAPMVALAPDLLAGMAMPVKPNADVLSFLPPMVASLPLLGGGNDANLEKLKDAGIDTALGWVSPDEQYPAQQLNRIGVPVVAINVDRLDQYPATFRFLGRLLKREARGEALAKGLEAEIERLRAFNAGLAPADRPRVYYTESMDGLTSQCDGADRAEVIMLGGGANAVSCDGGGPAGRRPLDMETLLAIDPDVIVARFPQAAALAKNDPRWANLKAVKAGKVYTAPALPYNWFDRPPSFMRALGALWMARTLHPGRMAIDLRAETKRLDTLFFGVEPAEADLDKLFPK
jgi:iron complex transport system substrate-binding protein